MKIRIVADIDIPFLKGALEDVASVVYLPGKKIDAAALQDAEALITRTRTRCDESLIKDSSLKFIASASIGYDHIDTEYCDRKGIEWTNAPGCNSSSVEQYILSVLLNLADRKKFRLSEKTIGIVGVGHVGSKVERICNNLGMNVLLNDPPRARKEGAQGFVDLSEIHKEADIITLHVPLYRSGTDKTFHMVDRDFLSQLKKNSILIDSSRGEVVDGDTLKKALVDGQLSAAVLDVWEGEPDLDLDLMGKVDIATPHIAGYSVDGKANATGMSVRALSRFFKLGLDEWQPVDLPAPVKNEILIDGSGCTRQDLLLEIYRDVYDVMRDDAVLRKNPASFEEQRASYPVRREPGAFKIRILNDRSGVGSVLEQLGYKVFSD